jgi:hypothetical protein
MKCLFFDILCTLKRNDENNQKYRSSSMCCCDTDFLRVTCFSGIFSHTTFYFGSKMSNQTLDKRRMKQHAMLVDNVKPVEDLST